MELKWHKSVRGGWYATDADGNRWYATSNWELYTVIATDGSSGEGWTPEQALLSLQEAP